MAAQVFASVTTLASSYYYGNKSLKGPVFGLISQLGWWSIMFIDSLWGLVIINAAMLALHVRNLRKWIKEKECNTPA